MKLEKLTLTLVTCLLAVGAGRAQVEDSVDVGGFSVPDLTHNPRSHVIYGISDQGMLFFALSCDSNRIVSSTALVGPQALAYDSTDSKAYVLSSQGGGTVSVFDGMTHHRVRDIPVPGAHRATWDSVSDKLFVSCYDLDRVQVVDCRYDSVVAEVRVGAGPLSMAVNSRYRKLYVLNSDARTISVLDMASNQVTRTLAGHQFDAPLCYNARFDRLYCAADESSLVVVDGATDSVAATVELPGRMYARSLANSAFDSLVALGASEDHTDSVYLLDPASNLIVASFPSGRAPRCMSWSPLTNTVYCACYSNVVTAVPGNGVGAARTIPVGCAPMPIARCMANRRVYVGHLNSRLLYVIRDTSVAFIAEDHDVRPETGPQLRVWPQPFRDKVVVELRGEVPSGRAALQARVYSQTGALVATLRAIPQRSGVYGFVWDGRDDGGTPAAAGIYYVVVAGVTPTRTVLVKVE